MKLSHFSRTTFLAVGILLATPASFSQNDPFVAKRHQTRDYLIFLQHPDHDFGNKLKRKGIAPAKESDHIWLATFNSSQERDVKQMPGVKQIKAGIAVMVQLEPGGDTEELASKLKALSGLVTYAYPNLPAVAVVLPVDAVPQARKLPGVKRISKQKTFVPAHTP